MAEKPLIALTMGDPAGIGPEIVLKTVFTSRANDAARLVVVGYPEPFERDAALLDLDLVIQRITSPAEVSSKPGVLQLIIPPKGPALPSAYGIVDAACGAAAGRVIERSAELALKGAVDAVVTAPINKESLNNGGYHYPGHTEFYQHLAGATDIAMLLTLGKFRVIHVVTHTAIREVPDLVTRDRILRVTTLLHEALVMLGIPTPRIAVSGLNPHAGEGGLFGQEEIDHIIPAVQMLQERDWEVTGPHPPDTVFARAYSGEFDAVVAMYHDQGHIALKLAGFKFRGTTRQIGGVNTTLGMSIIRTSVDHGTAFDIAGKGIASPQSMIEAVEMAAQMAIGRKKLINR